MSDKIPVSPHYRTLPSGERVPVAGYDRTGRRGDGSAGSGVSAERSSSLRHQAGLVADGSGKSFDGMMISQEAWGVISDNQNGLRDGDSVSTSWGSGTFGALDETAYLAFAGSESPLMAAALHEQTGWEVVAAGAPDWQTARCGCDGEDRYDVGTESDASWCPCMVRVVMVKDPSGALWDVEGPHDPEMVEGENYEVRSVPDAVFAELMWEHNEPDMGAYARSVSGKVLEGVYDGDPAKRPSFW